MKVTIVHPDLGIGGAERLVVDAAHAFCRYGHDVRIVTNQFSKDHCFGDLVEFFDAITTVSRMFPRHLFGRFNALCAYIRICIAALYICIFMRDTDVIFCDQISAPLLFFRLLLPRARLLFYGHFPDQLLTRRDTWLKSAYRTVIDAVEAWTTGLADVLFVNSRFTESVFRRQFPALAGRLNVLYPTLSVRTEAAKTGADDKEEGDGVDAKFECVFLSLNRFEIKKNVELAIRAFDVFRDSVSPAAFAECALVIAGGYDRLNAENIAYYEHLTSMVAEAGLADSVIFFKSPSDDLKYRLYRRARLVIYTPENEHFGIVPLEAMFMRRPVLATASGGPLETIDDGETGYLRPNRAEAFGEVMAHVYADGGEEVHEMGERGHMRVLERFGFDHFADRLQSFL